MWTGADIVALVTVLAWPVTILLIAFIIKRELNIK